MSIYALLRNKPRPTMEDITQALAGRSSDLLSSVGRFLISEVSVSPVRELKLVVFMKDLKRDMPTSCLTTFPSVRANVT